MSVSRLNCKISIKMSRRSNRRTLSLSEKVFLIKKYYEMGESSEVIVQAEFDNAYNLKTNESILRIIQKLVKGFETTGSVTQAVYLEGGTFIKIKKEESTVAVADELVEIEMKEEEDADKDIPEVSNPTDSLTLEGSTKMMEDEPTVDTEKASVNENSERKCPFCGKIFSKINSLRRHKRLDHGQGRNTICDVCGKVILNESQLTAHLRIHTGERPFQCELCMLSFRTKGCLKIHMQTHTGRIKPHKCSHCDKAYTSQVLLAIHIRTHTGERPFTCSVCGNSYGDASYLRMHMVIHTGERPHKCKQCPQTFAFKSHLISHVACHREERPHKCAQCPATFKSKCGLNRHMLVRHPAVTLQYNCSFCPKIFTRPEYLHAHALRGHPGQYKGMSAAAPQTDHPTVTDQRAQH